MSSPGPVPCLEASPARDLPPSSPSPVNPASSSAKSCLLTSAPTPALPARRGQDGGCGIPSLPRGQPAPSSSSSHRRAPRWNPFSTASSPCPARGGEPSTECLSGTYPGSTHRSRLRAEQPRLRAQIPAPAERPQHHGQIPAPGGTAPSPRADPSSGAPAPAPRTDPGEPQAPPAAGRELGARPGPAPCLGAPGSCVLLAARCGSGTRLCPEISPHALPPTLLTVPEEGLYLGSESAFCGSGSKSLDGAWLHWCMSLHTLRCTTELGRNLGSVTAWTSKINPIQPTNPTQAFLSPCNQLYTHTPNRENSLLSSSLHAPSFSDCRMRHFLLRGSG